MAHQDHTPHGTAALLEVLARQDLPSADLLGSLTAALRSHCPHCARNLEAAARLARKQLRVAGERPRMFAAVSKGVVPADTTLRFEHRRAAKQVAALEELPWEERLSKIQGLRSRDSSPVLVEALFAASRKALGTSVAEAGEWLDLAGAHLSRLRGLAGYSREFLAALSLRLAARRANLLRVASDLPAADEAWKNLRADPRLARVGNLATHADLASLEASLRLDQRRLERGAQLIAHAGAIYSFVGDSGGQVRVALLQAIQLRRRGEYSPALAQLEAAAQIPLTTGEAEHLLVMVGHNRALCLALSGQFVAAQEALEGNQALYKAHRTPESLRLELWLAGRIHSGLGDRDKATAALDAARKGFLTSVLSQEAALVTLDLAELHLHHGHLNQVQTLARETLSVFEQQEVPAEAARAIRLLAQAAVTDRLTQALVARLRRGLRSYA
ncbi:MAG: hypothetical protein AAF481_04785 [Acidobacteriota bacterium]